MSTNLSEFLDELRAAEALSLGAIEGYEDILTTDIADTTRRPVEQIHRLEKQRLEYVKRAREALEVLIRDGYPAQVVVEANDAAISDIMQNIASMQHAVARLSNREAQSASMTFGTPTLKT